MNTPSKEEISEKYSKLIALLKDLKSSNGGFFYLKNLTKKDKRIPKRGVYLFFDEAEGYIDKEGEIPRIVRVGTHGMFPGNKKSRLFNRLNSHKSNSSNSVFRKHIGRAIINKNGLNCPNWDIEKGGLWKLDGGYKEVQNLVSEYIEKLPFLVFELDGDESNNFNYDKRDKKETEWIELLCHAKKFGLVNPSRVWLEFARLAQRPTFECGLWNVDKVIL